MNGTDLARLEVAKRAYRANEPTATEVQRGVRRARIALRKPKTRRHWLSKGLVMVVLAVGGLAYAKPHALGELVSSVLAPDTAPTKGTSPGNGGGLPPVEPATSRRVGTAPTSATPGADAPALDSAATNRPASPGAHNPRADSLAAHNDAQTDSLAAHNDARTDSLDALARSGRALPVSTRLGQSAPNAAKTHASGSGASPGAAIAVAQNPASKSDEGAALSNWGRVGQALARGDEAKALSALSELSESDDPRTRDKADLGRAQLFMANGDRDQACAIARSLTHRRAGSRIERQAQLLLTSCAR